MERPRSMPRYSASRFAGMAAAAARGEDAEAAPLSTTSSAKRTRFSPPRRAFSRFLRFSDEERQGRRRGDGAPAPAAEEEGTCRWGGCLARQMEKRTSVPESAMAVAAMARPAWEPAEAEDEDGAITARRRDPIRGGGLGLACSSVRPTRVGE